VEIIENNISEKIKKKLDEIVENDECCDYCKYNCSCSHGVTNYGAGPCYPPCADKDYKDLVDWDMLEEEEE